jgi:translation initiation factor 3 subunit C
MQSKQKVKKEVIIVVLLLIIIKRMEKSRFFRRGGDSDSDSDSSSGGSSEDANVPQQRAGGGRFAFSDSESDSEDEKRVVISKDDKAKEGLNTAIKEIRNAKGIEDWSKVYDKFVELNKVIKKSHPLGNVPGLYIRVIAELEQEAVLAFRNKDAFNKMDKSKQQALKNLKQKVIKHNEDFKDKIADFKNNPNDKKYEAKKVILL